MGVCAFVSLFVSFLALIHSFSILDSEADELKWLLALGTKSSPD